VGAGQYIRRWRNPRLHIPLTYFYSKLTGEGRGYDYAGVQRWLRRVPLFPAGDDHPRNGSSSGGSSGGGSGKGGEAALVDAVLVPLHLGQNHWALMVSVFLARHLSQLFLTRKTER